MAESKKEFKKVGIARRQPVNLSREELVKVEPLYSGQLLPLLIQPTVKGVDLTAWASDHREFLENKLVLHGGLLFRGFDLASTEFKQFVSTLYGELLEDHSRLGLRSDTERVYTSTEHPADYTLYMHNETWWQYNWPMKIFFLCETAPQQGGETIISDCRRVLKRISPATKERFIHKKALHLRNFGNRFGRPWQQIFETDDQTAVEAFCQANAIECEWLDGNRLRTRHVRPVIAQHPHTGEEVWFNHVAHYHISTNLTRDMAGVLSEIGENNVPVNTFFGDGTPIEDAVMDEIRDAYNQETIAFPWEKGDLMMLDNMLVAHGRAPYTGPRKILVSMAQLTGWQQIGQL
ncbi:MAG TPA: TauD/TfdA family dioxygenase [Ktedonobacteraceae bacterium]|nr:TauD/TfdA family dioxygenase [Ktedonobacteraceae bacterium]